MHCIARTGHSRALGSRSWCLYSMADAVWLANTISMIQAMPYSKSIKDRLEFTAMRASRLPCPKLARGASVSSSSDRDLDIEIELREELSRESLKAAILKKPICGNARMVRNRAQHQTVDGSRLGCAGGGRGTAPPVQVFSMDGDSCNGHELRLKEVEEAVMLQSQRVDALRDELCGRLSSLECLFADAPKLQPVWVQWPSQHTPETLSMEGSNCDVACDTTSEDDCDYDKHVLDVVAEGVEGAAIRAPDAELVAAPPLPPPPPPPSPPHGQQVAHNVGTKAGRKMECPPPVPPPAPPPTPPPPPGSSYADAGDDARSLVRAVLSRKKGEGLGLALTHEPHVDAGPAGQASCLTITGILPGGFAVKYNDAQEDKVHHLRRDDRIIAVIDGSEPDRDPRLVGGSSKAMLEVIQSGVTPIELIISRVRGTDVSGYRGRLVMQCYRR